MMKYCKVETISGRKEHYDSLCMGVGCSGIAGSAHHEEFLVSIIQSSLDENAM